MTPTLRAAALAALLLPSGPALAADGATGSFRHDKVTVKPVDSFAFRTPVNGTPLTVVVVSDVKLDLRVGGLSEMTFHGPNGELIPNQDVYLELIPNEKIVFTSAFQADWEPRPQTDIPTDFIFVAKVLFERLPNGGTRYTARVMHWTKEACEKHKAMGFEQGWTIAFDQLLETVGQ